MFYATPCYVVNKSWLCSRHNLFQVDNRSSTACERFPLAHCRALSAAGREKPMLSNSSTALDFAKFAKFELSLTEGLGSTWSEVRPTAWLPWLPWPWVPWLPWGWNIGSFKASERPPAAAMMPSAVSTGSPVISASSSAWVASRGRLRDQSKSCWDGRLGRDFFGGLSVADRAWMLPTSWKIYGMCSSLQLLCSCSNLAWKQENGCPFSAHRSAKATSSVLRQQWPSESRQSYCPSSVFQPAARTNRTLLLSSEAISGYLCIGWSIRTQHNWLSLIVNRVSLKAYNAYIRQLYWKQIKPLEFLLQRRLSLFYILKTLKVRLAVHLWIAVLLKAFRSSSPAATAMSFRKCRSSSFWP